MIVPGKLDQSWSCRRRSRSALVCLSEHALYGIKHAGYGRTSTADYPSAYKGRHEAGTYEESFDVTVKGEPFGIVWKKTYEVSEHECTTPEKCPEVMKSRDAVSKLLTQEVLRKASYLKCGDSDVWVTSKGYPEKVSDSQ